jgi:hypothetical protein
MPKEASLSGGFNTDIRAGGKVYHVQTENRPKALSIDTAVYLKGHLVHHQSMSYATPENVAGLQGEDLLWRVEEEHRQIVEAIRDGALAMNAPQAEAAAAEEKAQASAGKLQLHLLNRTSWISGGNADLWIEVRGADGKSVVEGAQLEVVLEGGSEERHKATSDAKGHARIRFALKGGGGLLMRATHPSGKCEVRFALREKAKKPGDAGRK